ncbi:hypothetical protein BT93_H1566 [Corymbia citriodora subsp. variegata]|nr:hypothetical protein BT93_H1566 [Corymbia citriodora subsp. variegata]KAF8016051.1 hypothetical protein BT93_H1566 [Corymbia citriodora subsp. variegata]
MKRKRGHKKGKPKISVTVAANDTSKPNESNLSMEVVDPEGHESEMEADTPSSSETDQPCNVANINPDGSIDRTTGRSVGHVKVKLKTSKNLESQGASSEAPSRSDTDKSSQQGLEKQGTVSEKMDDSANSFAETIAAFFPANPAKKAGSIKIKTSRALVSSGSQTSNTNAVVGEGESSHRKEPRAPDQSSRYNKEELDAALMVIKKVMKMDAAEPFNIPVDPVALQIPDYFDVIDTPMDFGTICSNLENGVKYLDSVDVFKDVQYIWGNCYKYNNKGDYILDLMRRVKKNFMKYWTAAGLHTEQSKATNDGDIQQADMSSQGKGQTKVGKNKPKKRPGMRRHKNDCLCAICVLKRRRKEREEKERMARGQSGVGDELKQEDTSLVESPVAEDSSSDADDSLDHNADIEQEEKGEEVKLELPQRQNSPQLEKDNDNDEEEGENDMEIQKDIETQTPEQLQSGKSSGEDPATSQTKVELSGGLVDSMPKENTGDQHEETATVELLKQKEMERNQKALLYENFCENPMLLSLCGTLFPKKANSVWSGPHSLVPRPRDAHGSLHAAVESLMK